MIVILFFKKKSRVVQVLWVKKTPVFFLGLRSFLDVVLKINAYFK